MSINNKMKINKFSKLNNKQMYYFKGNDKIYKIICDKPIDEINFTEDFETEYIKTTEGKTMLARIIDKQTKQLIGILECYKSKDMLKKERQEKQRLKEELLKEKEELLKAQKIEKEKQRQKRKQEIENSKSYKNYIEYLLENNANKEILELKAVKDIIIDVIDRVDPRVRFEGRSPINYPDVREDGTFDIRGRTSGPVTREIYSISYADEDDAFIKIQKTIVKSVLDEIDEPEEKPIYVDKEGNIITPKKTGSKTK